MGNSHGNDYLWVILVNIFAYFFPEMDMRAHTQTKYISQ